MSLFCMNLVFVVLNLNKVEPELLWNTVVYSIDLGTVFCSQEQEILDFPQVLSLGPSICNVHRWILNTK